MLSLIEGSSECHVVPAWSYLVQDNNYTLARYRYIEMNPLRAAMVEHPAEYQWSSCRINGQSFLHHWLTPYAEYLAPGENNESRHANYRELFAAAVDPDLLAEIRTATHGNYALGNKRFKAEVSHMLKRRASRGKPERPAKVD